jgi:hypothetical protein
VASYIFDEILLAPGKLKISFYNDNGDATEYNILGDYFLNVAELNESVEENGIGGVLKISDMDFEVSDKDNIFQTGIFRRDNVTSVQMKVLLEVGGTDYSILYGDVDLTTIEYPTYFDDEQATEFHSCRFVVFSLTKRFDKITVSALRDALVAYTVDSADSTSDFVKYLDVFDAALKLIGIDTDYPTAITDDLIYRILPQVEFPAGADYGIEDVYIGYHLNRNVPNFFATWSNSGSQTFMNFRSAREVIEKLAGMILAYPAIIYIPSTDKIQFIIKQRAVGTIRYPADLGALKSSTNRTFYGYDAFRVKMVSTPIVSPVYTDEHITPAITAEQFELEQRKFDFLNYLALSLISGSSANDGVWARNGVDVFRYLDRIDFDSTVYTSYNLFLITNFERYWSNLGMYERLYADAGISTDTQMDILDRIIPGLVPNPFGAGAYTVVDIKRNFVDNEMMVKAVQF